MTLRLTFGIDPGLSGAIATLIDGEPGTVIDMPTRRVGDWDEVAADNLSAHIRNMRLQHPGAWVSACVEKVGARPDDGGTSAFRFGEGFGMIKAVLQVNDIPYTLAIPSQWKRHFCLLKTEKDAARELAIKRFPSMAEQLKRKKDGGRGDALLIALWHETHEMAGNRRTS